MEIVQRFKEKIAWYSPTTDEDTWREFEKNVYDVDYTNATVESLKMVAWKTRDLGSGADPTPWADRSALVHKFLAGDLAFDEGSPVEAGLFSTTSWPASSSIPPGPHITEISGNRYTMPPLQCCRRTSRLPISIRRARRM